MQLQIKIDDERLRRDLKGLGNEAEGSRMRKVMGTAVVNVMKKHFAKLSRARHRKAKKGRSFYAEAAAATIYDAARNAVAVTAPIGLRLRIKGGTIRAKSGKSLAIPLREALYGVRAKEVYDELSLFPLKTKRNAFLAYKDPSGALRFAYILKKSVTQRPDPTVAPDTQALNQSAVSAAESFIRRAIARRGLK